MKIAASMSVGRLAPKHSLNIDGIRTISKNVTPKLIKNDVILIDRLRSQDGKHLTIEEYTDQHFQPIIDQYNAKQRRKDRQIQTGYCEWHRGNGTLSQNQGFPHCYLRGHHRDAELSQRIHCRNQDPLQGRYGILGAGRCYRKLYVCRWKHRPGGYLPVQPNDRCE